MASQLNGFSDWCASNLRESLQTNEATEDFFVNFEETPPPEPSVLPALSPFPFLPSWAMPDPIPGHVPTLLWLPTAAWTIPTGFLGVQIVPHRQIPPPGIRARRLFPSSPSFSLKKGDCIGAGVPQPAYGLPKKPRVGACSHDRLRIRGPCGCLDCFVCFIPQSIIYLFIYMPPS